MIQTRKISNTCKQDCKKYKLKPEEKAFADLIMADWREFDAYLIVGLANPLLTDEANVAEMTKLKSSKAVTSYIAAKKFIDNSMSPTTSTFTPKVDMSDEEIANATSKQEQIKQLLIAKKDLVPGTKEWLDITKLIAEITQAKKDEMIGEDDTIHYYIPISCREDTCPYLAAYNRLYPTRPAPYTR